MRGRQGKIGEATAGGSGGLPALEIGDVGFCGVEFFAEGELADELSVALVGIDDGDALEAVEDVEFGEGEHICALHPASVTGSDDVEAAHPFWVCPSRRRTSPPASRSATASSPNISAVKGPSPTQEEYAFMMPMVLSSLRAGTPAPTGAYAAMVLEEEV